MTASANLNQTAISGKYGRVFVTPVTFAGAAGATYPVNLESWRASPEGDDIPWDGFENAGFGDGLVGIIRAELELEGAYQIYRADGSPAAGMSILVASAYFCYELYLTHTDYGATFGSINRFTGVAQVLGAPVKHEAAGTAKAMLTVRAKSRGPIYLPGVAAPTAAAQLAAFANRAG